MAGLDRLTEGYLTLSNQFLDNAGQLASDTFKSLGSWRDADAERFIEQISGPLMGIKSQQANATLAYHRAFALSNDKKFKPFDIAGMDLSTQALRNGANASTVYGRPFVQMRMALAKGKSVTEAVDTGAATARSLARTEVQLTKRQASLFARRANDNIVGYLRTLTGLESCSLCYVASTQRYRRGDLLPIHPGCDCGEMPIYGDSDPGQVIDRQLLEASHQAVEDRFGFSDPGAREIDYRKIIVRDHGEMGPLLTVKGHKFTGPNSLTLTGKKMAEPKPLPPASARVEAIREKASRIDGETIAMRISDEFEDPKFGEYVNVTGSKRKRLFTPGPAGNEALDEVLDLGKDVDDELSIRIKARIDELGQPYQADMVRREIERETFLRDDYTAKLTGAYNQIHINIRTSYTKRLNAEGRTFDDAEWQKYVDSPEYEKLFDSSVAFNKEVFDFLTEKKDYHTRRVLRLQDELDAEITPGSLAFDTIQREEFRKLLSEIRETGGGNRATVLASRPELEKLISDAWDEYPTDWINAFSKKYSVLEVVKSSRGGWRPYGGARGPKIEISGKDSRIFGDEDGFATAVHELGHGFEYSVPGIKALEYVFYMRRAEANNYLYQSWENKKEFGAVDDWRDKYSGREYGRVAPNEAFEIFTTGVESLLGGGTYFGEAIENQISDDNFRRFILGVLVGL